MDDSVEKLEGRSGTYYLPGAFRYFITYIVRLHHWLYHVM